MKLKSLFAFALTLFTSLVALARTPDFEGFVDLPNGLKIYCIQYAAKDGAPTLVLLNGLTYTTKPWQEMAKELVQGDSGLLIYDARGMGKTLEATGPAEDIIPIEQQADDLALLLDQRNLKQVDLAGLSYGGALGLVFTQRHPEYVGKLVLMAPYVKALKQQDDMIKQKVRMHRLIYPMDKRSDDEVYDLYLKEMIDTTYPIYEPVVKEHPWRLGAVYQMVRGVRKFRAVDIVNQLPAGKMHLVVAGKDQYVPVQDLNEFWGALKPEQRVSHITVTGSEHKLPEAVPHFMGGWLNLIVSEDARVSGGREFTGAPTLGTATASDVKIEGLPKDQVAGGGFWH